jgi:hypothetical protein
MLSKCNIVTSEQHKMLLPINCRWQGNVRVELAELTDIDKSVSETASVWTGVVCGGT